MSLTPIANTFLIGAQKSGTTYLASLLGQSPDVCVSNPKEPQFFSKHYDDGFDRYHQIFANPDAKVCLDASTTYTFLRPLDKQGDPLAPGIRVPVPARIKAYNPQSKLIYIMRDPVARIKSAIKHKARTQKGLKGEVSLAACVADDPMLLLVSGYAAQIEAYLDVWDRSQMHFVSFDTLKTTPQAVVTDLTTFLDIPDFTIQTADGKAEKHEAYQYRGHMQQVSNALSRNKVLKSALKAVLPIATLKKAVTVPSDVTFRDTAIVTEMFMKEKEKLHTLTGLSL